MKYNIPGYGEVTVPDTVLSLPSDEAIRQGILDAMTPEAIEALHEARANSPRVSGGFDGTVVGSETDTTTAGKAVDSVWDYIFRHM
jgi:hypothetical protein